MLSLDFRAPCVVTMRLAVVSADQPVGRTRAVPKILIITGDAAESLEVMYPYQRLQEEGYQVDIAAPSVKKLQFVVHDFVDGYDTYTEKPGYTWPADVAFADVNPADYVAL